MSVTLLSWDGPHHPDLSHHGGGSVGHVSLLLSLEVFLAQRRLGQQAIPCQIELISMEGNKDS